VARCWAYETAVLVGQPELVTDQLPSNMYLDNFKNEKEDVTRVPSLNADRMNIYRRGTIPDTYNRPGHLDLIRIHALEHLRHVENAPGILFNPAAAAVDTAPIMAFAVSDQEADHPYQCLAASCCSSRDSENQPCLPLCSVGWAKDETMPTINVTAVCACMA